MMLDRQKQINAQLGESLKKYYEGRQSKISAKESSASPNRSVDRKKEADGLIKSLGTGLLKKF